MSHRNNHLKNQYVANVKPNLYGYDRDRYDTVFGYQGKVAKTDKQVTHCK